MTTDDENESILVPVQDTKIVRSHRTHEIEIKKTNFNIQEFVRINLKKIIYTILPIFYFNEYNVFSNKKFQFFKTEAKNLTEVESNSNSLITTVFSYLSPRNLMKKLSNLNQRQTENNNRFGLSPISQFILKINHFNFL